jgi:glyoxylase-like metal-dependent hydrolase (beta-lactamase superfamily II)
MTTRLAAASLVAASLLLAAPAARAGGCCATWDDLGSGLAGSNGVPLATGTGTLSGGNVSLVGLNGALENSITTLVVGFSQLNAPFKGGVLVPNPDLLLGPIPTSVTGTAEISGLWPFGVPSETQIAFQWWVPDAAGPAGLAASNGLLGTTPHEPVAGTFPADWVFGDCGEDPIQVHKYDDSTWILRQSQCTNFEGPFMYLLFGTERAMLLDTGAGGIPIGNFVRALVEQYEQEHGLDLDLLVTHTHGHGDHFQGDGQFNGQPNTTVVGVSQSAVASFYGFQDWPNDIRTLDLGGRVLDVLAIPGHQAASVAHYDRETGLLLTGDTLYPGFLFIIGAVGQGNFAVFRDSIQRMVDFTTDKPVTWVLGTHVEMTSTPGVAYPYGTDFQPLERVLELTRDHLVELLDALIAMGSTPFQDVHDDFIITPAG